VNFQHPWNGLLDGVWVLTVESEWTQTVRLKRAFRSGMKDHDDLKPVRRSDWRAGLSWIYRRREHTLFAVMLLVFAGFASVFGLLRWKGLAARWSFAILCWVSSAAISFGKKRMKR
jgi:hypothetical protein